MQLADGSEVEVGAELGRGSGAVVREGVWRGKPVAVKARLGLDRFRVKVRLKVRVSSEPETEPQPQPEP